MVEVPSERSCQSHRSLIHDRWKDSGRGIVKHDAELAFIFAAELAHLERAGAGRGFPVHMAGGIVGHVLADEVKVVAAAADKGFELARDHGKNLEKLFGGLNDGIDDHFANEVDPPGFHQEGERKARGQAEVLFAVATAGWESYLQVGAELLFGSEKRKINGRLQDRLFRFLVHTAQAAVGQAEPLGFGRTIGWEAEGRGFPSPAVFIFFAFGGNHAHGKRRQPRTGVAQEHACQHRTTGKDVFGQVNVELETTQRQRRSDAGDQNRREQRGDDDVKQIVAGVNGGDSDHNADQNVDHASARDVVVHGFADAAGDDATRQVGHGGEADEDGEQECRRGQNDGSPEVAGLTQYGGKKGRAESHYQAHDGQQESYPNLRESQRKAGCSGVLRADLGAFGNQVADHEPLRCRTVLLPAYAGGGLSESDGR